MIREMTASALLCYGVAGTRGTSDAAFHVSSQMEKGRRHMQSSFSLGLRGKGVFDELFATAEECQAGNWDGHGAVAISDETYRLAYQFLEALPLGTPVPSIGAEPDGNMTVEWYRSPRRTLSVSIAPDGDLHYAALLGASKAYGTEPFFGAMPKVILDLVARVMLA
jgi:hypothetical protein